MFKNYMALKIIRNRGHPDLKIIAAPHKESQLWGGIPEMDCWREEKSRQDAIVVFWSH